MRTSGKIAIGIAVLGLLGGGAFGAVRLASAEEALELDYVLVQRPLKRSLTSIKEGGKPKALAPHSQLLGDAEAEVAEAEVAEAEVAEAEVAEAEVAEAIPEELPLPELPFPEEPLPEAVPEPPPIDPHIARQQALQDAVEFGMIGMLDSDSAPGAGGLGRRRTPQRRRNMNRDSLDSGTGHGYGDASRPRATIVKVRTEVKDLEVDADSGLDKANIERLLRRRGWKFRSCYRKGLKSSPSLSGVVHLEITVDETGRLVIGKHEDAILSTVSRDVADCVLDALSGWEVKNTEGVRGTFSFKLTLSQS